MQRAYTRYCLLNNFYVTVGDSLFDQTIGIPMVTNCIVFLADFYLFTYEFDFMKHLISMVTCLVVEFLLFLTFLLLKSSYI